MGTCWLEKILSDDDHKTRVKLKRFWNHKLKSNTKLWTKQKKLKKVAEYVTLFPTMPRRKQKTFMFLFYEDFRWLRKYIHARRKL